MTSISLVSRTGLLVASCVGLPTLLACLDHPLKPVEYEAVQEGREGIALTVNKDVDIIFMIDDSGSMAEEQLALAENFGEFIRVLERPGVEANYRIGITTSDKGNPLCPTTTKQPDDGKFKLSTCRSRQSHFTFATVPPVEAFQVACADICPYETIEILPTPTDQEPDPSPRPWVESIEGVTNIGCAYRPGSNECEEITTEEAFQCLGPMGIAGCGYEEQLENVYRAVLRTQNDNEDQYGFIRPNAILAVVLVSDEADGSLNRSSSARGQDIYDVNGNKLFWQDPDANFPTSTVSWKAGVECVGGPTPFDDCYAQHYNVDREVVPEERAMDEAVLYPVARYINQIQAIEDQKKQLNPNQEVLVAGILGVTSDYSYGDDITYREDPTDPQFVNDFGVGAGCISQLVVEGLEAFQPKAVPPVRQKDFVEHFVVDGETNIFSVCDQDYARALQAIARMIEDQIRPACMPACVQDMDPTTPELDASCVLEQEAPSATGGGVERTIIPECEDQDGTMPDDAVACYVMRTGDDMDQACIDEGWNLEFQLFRAAPAPGGTSVSATCELSPRPQVDCPNL